MKLTEDQQSEFLEHLRNGVKRGAAAYMIGCATRIEMIDYIAEHPEYARLCDDAEEEAKEHVDEAIWQAAVSGSTSAARLWYQLQRPQAAPMAAGVDDTDWDTELAEINKLTGE